MRGIAIDRRRRAGNVAANVRRATKRNRMQSTSETDYRMEGVRESRRSERLIEDAGPGGPDEAHGKDGELLPPRNRGAAGEDVVVGAFDPLQKRVVDGGQYPERGTADRIAQGQKKTRAAVVVFSETRDGGKQFALGGRGRRDGRAMKQSIESDAVLREIFKRQIHAVAGSVLGDIAENVGELEG